MRERLRRLGGPLAVAAAVGAGGVGAGWRGGPLLGWAAVSGVGLAAATGALNERDRRREGSAALTVFAGALGGVAGAMLVGGTAVLVALLAFALAATGWARARLVRPVLAGLPLFYGALAVGAPRAGILPWVFAAWLFSVRELAAGGAPSPAARWSAAGLALAFIPASLVVPARLGYPGPYYLIVLFADLAILVVATRLVVGRTDRVGLLLDVGMAVGLVALAAGRV